MKQLILFPLALLSTIVLFAQPIKPAGNDAFGTSFSKVVLDFAGNFSGIQGGHMPAEVDADSYLSKVCIPAAKVCKVMRYHSEQDKSASWQAVLYSGESFEEAVKLYKQTFNQVKKTSIRGIDPTATSFDGKLETVDENVGFGVSTLRLKTKNKSYKDLAAEVEISSNYTGWEVYLNVYAKKLAEEKPEEKD